MYIDRKYSTWREGLIHLVVVIAVPIIPVIIYMIDKGQRDSYLYVLLLTVIFSLLYEFMSNPKAACSKWIKVEGFVSSVALILMLLISTFLLYLSFTNSNSIPAEFTRWDCLFLSLFSVPIIATVVEIVRCFIYDIDADKYQPDTNNNLNGASKV